MLRLTLLLVYVLTDLLSGSFAHKIALSNLKLTLVKKHTILGKYNRCCQEDLFLHGV